MDVGTGDQPQVFLAPAPWKARGRSSWQCAQPPRSGGSWNRISQSGCRKRHHVLGNGNLSETGALGRKPARASRGPARACRLPVWEPKRTPETTLPDAARHWAVDPAKLGHVGGRRGPDGRYGRTHSDPVALGGSPGQLGKPPPCQAGLPPNPWCSTVRGKRGAGSSYFMKLTPTREFLSAREPELCGRRG